MPMNGEEIEEIAWKCLVLGGHHPHEFDDGKWISDPREDYPIDIVLGLVKISNVYKVVIMVNDQFPPSKIELALGLGKGLKTDYKNARLAEYGRPISMKYEDAPRVGNRIEAKNVFMDSAGQYLWILVHSPIDVPSNPKRIVGIDKLIVLGYPLSDDNISERHSTSEGTPTKQVPTTCTDTSVVTAPPPGRYSYYGDGMYTSSSALAGDPLTTIRLVKNVLNDKLKEAHTDGRGVEATVCLRATQRLMECETMLVDLASQRSKALVYVETDKAKDILMSMAHLRDTVLRAIHVDLLLGPNELRSIGINSLWAKENHEDNA